MTIPARSFCVSKYHQGPRWLLSVYFYASVNAKNGLQSHCITCTKTAVRERIRNLPPEEKRKRSEYSRKYKEAKRRTNGVPNRAHCSTHFWADRLYAYLQPFIVTEYFTYENGKNKDAHGTRELLNGIPLTPNDASYIRKIRDGKVERSTIDRVDKLSTYYDLPLWEIQEAAGCFKKDKRAIARDNRIIALRRAESVESVE